MISEPLAAIGLPSISFLSIDLPPSYQKSFKAGRLPSAGNSKVISDHFG